jgi:hypothetical protein
MLTTLDAVKHLPRQPRTSAVGHGQAQAMPIQVPSVTFNVSDCQALANQFVGLQCVFIFKCPIAAVDKVIFMME